MYDVGGGVEAEKTFDTFWNISQKALNGSNKSQTIDVKCWKQKHLNPGIIFSCFHAYAAESSFNKKFPFLLHVEVKICYWMF